MSSYEFGSMPGSVLFLFERIAVVADEVGGLGNTRGAVWNREVVGARGRSYVK